MSSTGTRKPRDVQSRASEGIIEADKEIINSFKVFAESSNSVAGLAGPAANNSPKTPAGNYLAREGDSMIGPLALGPPLDFTIEVDAADTIDIGPLNENVQYSSNIQLDDLQTDSAVLTIIANAAFDGQILILRTFAPTIAYTISQGTVGNSGNIQTGDSNDLTVGDLQTVMLIFDESLIINANTGGTWRVMSISDATAGGFSFPILWPKESLTPAATTTETIDLSSSDGQAKQIQFPAGDISLGITGDPVATVAEEVHIMFIQDGTGGRSLTSVDSAIKNGANMDLLLDKAANAKTMFKLITMDAGVSYHAILIDTTTLTGGYTTIQDEGTALTQRATFNFIGPNVTAVDNAGSNRTDITISTGSGALSTLTIDVTKSWLGFGIFDLLYLESNAANTPGSGFLRMGTAEEIRMRNPANTDDLIITSGVDAAAVQAILFKVASGNQLTISEFDIDVVDNDIINTGDVVPGAGAHQVGDSTDFYNQMHSQFFVPEAATIITNRFGLAKTGNRLYVNYDDTNADAGFGIYEEGLQNFLFSNPLANVHELFIGPDPFNSGEEYRIQMGENSTSSARIFFIEGGGNDLILDRQGSSTTRGVQLRSNGLSNLISTNVSTKFFSDIDTNAQNVINTVSITSDGGGGASTGVIGGLVTADGGFDYYLRNKIFWDTDPATFIGMDTDGIDIVSDDGILISALGVADSFTIASVPTINMIITASTGINFLINGSTRATIQDNGLVMQEEIFMGSNKITNMLDPTSPQDAATKKYVDDNAGGGGTGTGHSVVKEFSLPVVNNSTTLVDDAELKFDALASTVYYLKFNVGAFSNTSPDIKYGIKIPTGANYRIAFGAGFGTEFSASTGTSGGETLNFSTSTGDLGQHQFVVIVEMGGTPGEVALQFAQNSADASNTTLQRGSLMEVFEQGTSGGASGLSFNDFNIGTISVPDFWRQDDDRVFIGNDNGSSSIGITLGNVEPAGFTFTYVVKSTDFPDSLTGMSLSNFRFCSSLQYVVGDATTQIIRAKTFVNSVEIGGTSSNSTGAGLFGMIGKSDLNTNITAGDTIQLKLWSDAGLAVTLEKFAVFLFPRSINITAHNIAALYPDDFTDNLVAGDPAGFSSVDFVDMGPVDDEYVINGTFNNNFDNLWPDSVTYSHFGDSWLLAPGSTQVFTRTADSSTDDFIIPGLKGMANIKIVTLS